MMQTKKADLWKDGDNNEINPEFTSSTPETAQKWEPSIKYLKENSIQCTEFHPDKRPNFEDLTEELQRKYENDYANIHAGEDDTYEGGV